MVVAVMMGEGMGGLGWWALAGFELVGLLDWNVVSIHVAGAHPLCKSCMVPVRETVWNLTSQLHFGRVEFTFAPD